VSAAGAPVKLSRLRRLLRRRPWVNGATALIVAGTIGYLIVSHFPDD